MSLSVTSLLVGLVASEDFAKEKGVPAYVIFRDRSLLEMARDRPSDPFEFAQVFGVGEAKVRDFAQPFLSLISEFSASPEATESRGR